MATPPTAIALSLLFCFRSGAIYLWCVLDLLIRPHTPLAWLSLVPSCSLQCYSLLQQPAQQPKCHRFHLFSYSTQEENKHQQQRAKKGQNASHSPAEATRLAFRSRIKPPDASDEPKNGHPDPTPKEQGLHVSSAPLLRHWNNKSGIIFRLF
ncbi:hypothetical protein V8C44DRAFT_327881 [Trichoderma aethiopicum]